RGEALASVAAVSKTTISSRRRGTLEGNKLVIVGGQMKEKNPAGLSAGTEISVENLFFNTPVRKKFLKTESTEIAHILNTVCNHSIAYPHIHFKLYSDDKLLFESVKHPDRLNSILDIYGHSIGKDLITVKDSFQDMRVEAYLGSPNISRKSRDRQKIFVNNRFIRNSSISAAAYNAYKTLLTIGEHPVFIIFLDISPESVDVNIHPAKSEVRFTDNQRVMFNMENILKKGLMKSPFSAPRVNLKSYTVSELTGNANYKRESESGGINNSGYSENKELIINKKITEAENQELGLIKTGINTALSGNIEKSNCIGKEFSGGSELNGIPANFVSGQIPNYKIIGQSANLYIIIETDAGLKIIDQHAAHERILYNKFMEAVKNKESVEAQLLLMPLNVEVTQAEKIVMREWLPVLNKLGFEMEEFGANSFLIRSMPVFSGIRADDKRILLDLIDDIISFGKLKNFDEMIRHIIATMACRAAIKAGCRLMPSEMKDITEKILTDNTLASCPHGRPTSIDITFDELEKSFKRKK
nr:DNA mismatch repair endonuclease MutL [bacterium]